MDIHILTHGRRNRQVTYDGLPQKWKDRVVFVVQEREAHLWEGMNRIVLPDHVRNLHQTRQWLLENTHSGKVMEMDDDVVFSARREDEPTKFRPMEPEDYDNMFAEVERLLDDYMLVGISHREGANRNTDETLFCTRQMRVHAFCADAIGHNGFRWDLLRSPGPEDFCMTLQCLTNGFPNAVANQWVHNQGGSNQSGGCSGYRTLGVHKDACEHLAEMFPGLVKVVEKETKTSWGGGKRTDVTVYWKKAYESSK